MRRITQLFVNRPPLVFVLVAVIALAGGFALATLVQQQFPNIDFPTINVSVSYPGASPTELRDSVVRPIEDAIAGAPDLSYINTSIQQNQASISATFSLDSNQTTDLTEVQDRVQTASAALPSDLPAPSVRTFDPAQATVVTISVTSQSLSVAALSAIVTNNIVPAIEQVPGISYVGANGTVTQALEVLVDPEKLAGRSFTTTDVVTAIQSNNVRAPGGTVYSDNRETSLDIRGDVQTPASVANLLLSGSSAVLLGATSPSGTVTQKYSVLSGSTNQALALSNSNTTTSSAATSGNAAAAEASTETTLAAANAGGSGSSASTSQSSTGEMSSLPSGANQTGAATPTPSPLTANSGSTVTTSVVSSSVSSAGNGSFTPQPTIPPLIYAPAAVAAGASTPAPSPAPAMSAFVPAANTTVAASVPASYSALTPVGAGSGVASSGLGSETTNPYSTSSQLTKIGDVATVVDSYEPKRVYSYVNGKQAITLNVQKATGASEVTSSEAVVAALPAIEAQYPDIAFHILNVQADDTKAQLFGVLQTLIEGIVFTGIAMLFFLRSWRNSLVVMVAIPTSLFVTFFAMKLGGFTIDTISLLAMTLIIGILVDDSIVVLENIERHFEGGEAPRTAAILGRSEIGGAAVVITLVDVVVFLPIAFLPGITGRFLAEFGIVVTIATLTSLIISFTITPSIAGNWSLLSNWRPPRLIEAFSDGFARLRNFYSERVLSTALRHPKTVAIASGVLTVGAISLIPLGLIGFEFIPSVDRGQIFVSVQFPTGTPLATTDAAVRALTNRFLEINDVQQIVSTSGTTQQGFGGSTNLGSNGQLRVFLNANRKNSTDAVARTMTGLGHRLVTDGGGTRAGIANRYAHRYAGRRRHPQRHDPVAVLDDGARHRADDDLLDEPADHGASDDGDHGCNLPRSAAQRQLGLRDVFYGGVGGRRRDGDGQRACQPVPHHLRNARHAHQSVLHLDLGDGLELADLRRLDHGNGRNGLDRRRRDVRRRNRLQGHRPGIRHPFVRQRSLIERDLAFSRARDRARHCRTPRVGDRRTRASGAQHLASRLGARAARPDVAPGEARRESSRQDLALHDDQGPAHRRAPRHGDGVVRPLRAARPISR